MTTPPSTPNKEEKNQRAGVADSPAEDWRADFNSLWRGSAASQVGAVCTAIATPLLVLSLTGSAKWAGWATAASILSGLVFYIPAGIVADRCDRRLTMLVSQSLRLCIMSALVGTLVLCRPRPEILLVAAFADGALTTFYSTAEFASIPRIIPNGVPLSSRVAKNESRNHIALLLGRPIGGTLYWLYHALPYVADLLAALFSIITVHRISAERFSSEAEKPHDESTKTQLRESITWIFHDPYTVRVLLTCILSNFAFQIVFLFLVVEAVHGNRSSYAIGLLTAATGFGGMTGSFAAPKALNRLSSFKILLLSVCVWVSLPVTAICLSDVEYSMAVWAGVSFMGANLNVALHVHLMTHAPRRYLGQVTSVNGLLLRGATAFGALCGGYLISWNWDRKALEAIIVTMLVILLSLWFTRKGVSAPQAVASETPTGTPTGPSEAGSPEVGTSGPAAPSAGQATRVTARTVQTPRPCTTQEPMTAPMTTLFPAVALKSALNGDARTPLAERHGGESDTLR